VTEKASGRCVYLGYRTADPVTWQNGIRNKKNCRLTSRPELRVFPRRSSDSAVTGRQGREFRAHFAAARSLSGVRGRSAEPTAPGGLASPVRARRRGARTRQRYPRATGPRCTRPRPMPALPGHACRASARPARPRGITPAHMSELTATLLPAASHTRLASPQPPATLFYRQGPVSVWEPAGRSGSATTGAFRVWRAFLSQQVTRREYRLAGGKEPRPVRGVNRVRAVLPDGWLCSAPH
jgi:hypothetical protein